MIKSKSFDHIIADARYLLIQKRQLLVTKFVANSVATYIDGMIDEVDMICSAFWNFCELPLRSYRLGHFRLYVGMKQLAVITILAQNRELIILFCIFSSLRH